MPFFRSHTYQELEELIYRKAGVVVPAPQTVVNAAYAAYDLRLISRRALNRVLADYADDACDPPQHA